MEQGDIEEALKLSNPTVSGTLDRLERKGLVKRLPDPENRRVNQIALTEKALAEAAPAARQLRIEGGDLRRQLLLFAFGQREQGLHLAFAAARVVELAARAAAQGGGFEEQAGRRVGQGAQQHGLLLQQRIRLAVIAHAQP